MNNTTDPQMAQTMLTLPGDPPVRIKDGSIKIDSEYDIVPEDAASTQTPAQVSDQTSQSANETSAGGKVRPKKRHKLKDADNEHIRRVVVMNGNEKVFDKDFSAGTCEIGLYWTPRNAGS